MAKQARGNLREYAKLAKDRLRENNYVELKLPARKASISAFAAFRHDAQKQDGEVRAQVTVINSYDEILYKRVCDMLSAGSIINPVSDLIDRKVFNNLDVEAKQRYINTLNIKYKELKTRYYREHAASIGY